MTARAAATFFARVAVSVLLLAFLFSRVSLGESLAELKHLRAEPLLWAALLVAVDRLAMALKWFVLVRPVLPGYPFGATLRIFFVGNFLGLLLPPGLGNDVFRAVGAWRETGEGARSVSSVALERAIGVVSLVLFAMATLVLSPVGPAGPALLVPAAILGIVVTLGIAALLDRRLPDKVVAFVERTGLRAAALRLRRLADALALYRAHPRALLASFGLGLGVQWLRVLIALLLGRALGIAAPAAAYYAFIPLVTAMVLLPISAGGFGPREIGCVELFGTVGVPEESAVALSLLTFLAATFGALPGAAFLLAGGPWRRKPGGGKGPAT